MFNTQTLSVDTEEVTTPEAPAFRYVLKYSESCQSTCALQIHQSRGHMLQVVGE